MIPRSFEVLTADEARASRDQVHAMRSGWNSHGYSEFYTLGASAYIEAASRGAIAYTLAAKRQKPSLQAAFGAVYERVRATIEAALGEPAAYSSRLALPGFHIFLSDPTFAEPVCSVHVDRPHERVSWHDWEAVDPTRTISFTLALAIPRGGAGLNVWHQIAPAEARSQFSLRERTAGLEPTLHPYAVGRMVLHDGHSIHQIAPFRAVGAGDERITLQGHGIRGAQGWILYF